MKFTRYFFNERLYLNVRRDKRDPGKHVLPTITFVNTNHNTFKESRRKGFMLCLSWWDFSLNIGAWLNPNPISGPKNHNNNTMTLFDKNNTPVQEGDYLKGCFGGYYQLQGDSLCLICEERHPCKDIPYAFVPELFERVLPSEVRATPAETYPNRVIVDPQTKKPIVSSITIGNLWVDAGHIKGVFYLAIADEKGKEHTIILTPVQAATLRDFITLHLKPPL